MRSLRHLFAFRASLASLAAAVLWCFAALSAGYWYWQWPSAPSLLPSGLSLEGGQGDAEAGQAMARVFGGMPSQPTVGAEDSRLQLMGVIADLQGQGRALIAIDGQVPQTYRVGQAVGDGLVLQSLSPRAAQLGAALNAPVLVQLQLPALNTP